MAIKVTIVNGVRTVTMDGDSRISGGIVNVGSDQVFTGDVNVSYTQVQQDAVNDGDVQSVSIRRGQAVSTEDLVRMRDEGGSTVNVQNTQIGSMVNEEGSTQTNYFGTTVTQVQSGNGNVQRVNLGDVRGSGGMYAGRVIRTNTNGDINIKHSVSGADVQIGANGNDEVRVDGKVLSMSGSDFARLVGSYIMWRNGHEFEPDTDALHVPAYCSDRGYSKDIADRLLAQVSRMA